MSAIITQNELEKKVNDHMEKFLLRQYSLERQNFSRVSSKFLSGELTYLTKFKDPKKKMLTEFKVPLTMSKETLEYKDYSKPFLTSTNSKHLKSEKLLTNKSKIKKRSLNSPVSNSNFPRKFLAVNPPDGSSRNSINYKYTHQTQLKTHKIEYQEKRLQRINPIPEQAQLEILELDNQRYPSSYPKSPSSPIMQKYENLVESLSKAPSTKVISFRRTKRKIKNICNSINLIGIPENSQHSK
jgi:hypothetical protein